MRRLSLMLLALLVVTPLFTGCEKESIQAKEEIPANLDNFSEPFHKEITDTYLALTSLLSTVMKQAMKKPQLYFLSSEAMGDTREGCPGTSVDSGSFPKILTLTFGTASKDEEVIDTPCDNESVVTEYLGTVNVTFNSALGSDAAGATPEILVAGGTTLEINGYVLQLSGGNIELDRTDGFNYNFIIKGTLTSSKNGTTISVPSNTTGTFTLDAPSDTEDPATYINSPFMIGLNPTVVSCASGANTNTFCASTSADLRADPLGCSCPTSGLLNIGSADCASDGTTKAYNFGNSYADRPDDCDNEVEGISVVEFISWGGQITANDLEAAGKTSDDIGLIENRDTPPGTSLQLQDSGSGSTAQGFFWNSSAATFEAINTNQTIENTNPPNDPWINEIHYVDSGDDMTIGIEIAGKNGFSLTNYCLRFYAADGTGLSTKPLTGKEIQGERDDLYGTVVIVLPELIDPDNLPNGIAIIHKQQIVPSFCLGSDQ